MRGARRGCFLRTIYTPVAGECRTSTSVGPNISAHSGEERDGEAERRQASATSSTMLTFRKRVRSASTVISVFSEWPESLGPPALPKASPWLRETRRERETFSFVCTRPSVYRSVYLSPRCWRSYPLTELNSFGASSDASSEDSARELKPNISLCPDIESLGKLVCTMYSLVFIVRFGARMLNARMFNWN